MANTFSTNYGYTKSEIGANNDNWGTDLNTGIEAIDGDIVRKVDKTDVVTQTSNKIAFAGTTITANSSTASTLFENFQAGDVISIAGSSNSANNGNHTISSKTNAYTLVTGTSFTTESEGTTLSYHLVPKYSEINIDGGTVDGVTVGGATIATSDVTVGSSKTLDVSGGTLTTSTAQKQAIEDGAVNRDGTPKLIKVQALTGTSSSDEVDFVDTNWIIAHDSISFSATSGKLYLIYAHCCPIVSQIQTAGSGGSSTKAFVGLCCETTERERADNLGALGNIVGKLSHRYIFHQSYLSSGVVQTSTDRDNISLQGALVAGSTATHYVHFAGYWMKHGGSLMRFEHGNDGNSSYFSIYEISGVSLTSGTSSSP